MVREARFAWDSEDQAPRDLNRSAWDCEDPDVDPGSVNDVTGPRKKPRRRRKPKQSDERSETDLGERGM